MPAAINMYEIVMVRALVGGVPDAEALGSVKLHRAVSWQVGTEHGLGVCQRGMADPRDGE